MKNMTNEEFEKLKEEVDQQIEELVLNIQRLEDVLDSIEIADSNFKNDESE